MELKYNYLYNGHDQVVSAEIALKDDYKIHLDGSLDYTFVEPYNRTDGTLVSGHFKLKSENPFASLSGNCNNNESPEHLNAKLKIVFEKGYFDTIFNKFISFEKVVEEKKQGNKRPDLSCYIGNNLVCLIEIKHTNKKSELDIFELKKIGVTVIEIDTDGRTKHIVLPKILESNKREFERVTTEVENLKRKYSELTDKLYPTEKENIKRFINWLSERKNREFKTISRRTEQFKELREEATIDRDIKRVKNEIEKTNYRIGKLEQDIERLKNDINSRRKSFNEIARKSKIEWFRNKWMKYRTSNIVEEIKYWLR